MALPLDCRHSIYINLSQGNDMGWLDRFFGPPKRPKFAALMQRCFRDIGDPRSSKFNEAEFQLEMSENGEAAGFVNLANLYTTYCQIPKQNRAEWLRQTCIAFAKPLEVPEDFEEAKHDLYPAVRTRSILEIARFNDPPPVDDDIDIPCEFLSEHLIACLVYDGPNSIAFITNKQFRSWNVSWYTAMEAARANLDTKQGRTLSLGDKVYVCDSDDAYDATRILKIDQIRNLPVAGDYVAMPFTRDCLIITGADDSEGLGMMADLALSMNEAARPICSIPHRHNGEGWEAWMPAPDQPHHEKFRDLEQRYYACEYAEQQRSLDKLNQRNGNDVFVATYSGLTKPTGENRSFATWSKGVPTWLPKTDLIAFFDPDTKTSTLAEWDRIVAVVGDQMTALEHYPPRWAVDSFPTAEELERIGSV